MNSGFRRLRAWASPALEMAFCSAASRTLQVFSSRMSHWSSDPTIRYPRAHSIAATASLSRSFIWHP